jgi:hypothetical protein
MTYLNYFSILVILIGTANGSIKGWLSQLYYLLFVIVFYVFFRKISHGDFFFVILQELDPHTQKIVQLEVVFISLLFLFYGVRKLHNAIFEKVDEVPGHKVVGALLGLVISFFLIVFLGQVIELTHYREDEWWISSIEYDLSAKTLDFLNFVIFND